MENPEGRALARSVVSTASKRRKSAKAIRYSARALSQFILVATGVFLALALLGVSVQAYKFVRGNTSSILPKAASPKVSPNPEAESLSSMAIAATVTALRLWGKLLLSILIPTTEHSLVYAKEGWGALEPSLRQSVLWFLFETTPTFKLGVFLSLVAAFLVWLLEREIKRRRIVERISARVKRVTDRVNSFNNAVKEKYAQIRTEVERESRIAAQLLPHILYVTAVVLAMLLFPDVSYQVSRGFAGWGIIVGWPVLLSARRMIHYDEVRRGRLKRLNPDDDGLSSSENEDSEEEMESDRSSTDSTSRRTGPNKRKAEVYVESMVQYVRKRFLSDASLSPVQVSYGLSSETIVDYDPITEWLRYWSVLSVCLFIEQFPLSGHFLSVVPIWPEIRLAYSLWLQLPVTRGCDLAFTAIVPLLDRYVKKIPALQMAQNQLGAASVEQRGVLVSVLSALGLVSKRTGKKLLKATEMNGTLIMVSVPFMLSPSFVTKIGVLIVGLAFPAHASTTCVLELDHLKTEMKKHDQVIVAASEHQEQDDQSSNDPSHSDAGDQSVFWLEYWVVYVLFSLIHAPLATVFGWWFPLWDQFHLALLLWLQISYFSGARNIFNVAVVIGRVWRRRRRAATRRRRRASSVPDARQKLEEIVNSIPLLSPLVVTAMEPNLELAPSPEPGYTDEDERTDTEGEGERLDEGIFDNRLREGGSEILKDADAVIMSAGEGDNKSSVRRFSSRAPSDTTIDREPSKVSGDDSDEVIDTADTTLSATLDGEEFVAVEKVEE